MISIDSISSLQLHFCVRRNSGTSFTDRKELGIFVIIGWYFPLLRGLGAEVSSCPIHCTTSINTCQAYGIQSLSRSLVITWNGDRVSDCIWTWAAVSFNFLIEPHNMCVMYNTISHVFDNARDSVTLRTLKVCHVGRENKIKSWRADLSSLLNWYSLHSLFLRNRSFSWSDSLLLWITFYCVFESFLSWNALF